MTEGNIVTITEAEHLHHKVCNTQQFWINWILVNQHTKHMKTFITEVKKLKYIDL